jgi:predicted protein tyrosine phosphatase
MPLPTRIAVCGIPEIAGFRDAGVTHVLSMIDPQADQPPVDGWLAPRHWSVLRFHDVTRDYAGYDPPEVSHVMAVLAFGQRVEADRPGLGKILVHCHMGISRSTAAAAILMAQLAPGSEAAAFAALHQVRPRCWPNTRMVAYADALLSRNGTLIAALKAHQREILRHHPDIADLVRGVGRADELPD